LRRKRHGLTVRREKGGTGKGTRETLPQRSHLQKFRGKKTKKPERKGSTLSRGRTKGNGRIGTENRAQLRGKKGMCKAPWGNELKVERQYALLKTRKRNVEGSIRKAVGPGCCTFNLTKKEGTSSRGVRMGGKKRTHLRSGSKKKYI